MCSSFPPRPPPPRVQVWDGVSDFLFIYSWSSRIMVGWRVRWYTFLASNISLLFELICCCTINFVNFLYYSEAEKTTGEWMERSQDRFGVWAIIPKDGGLEGKQTFTDYQE